MPDMNEVAAYFPNDGGHRLFGILQQPDGTDPRRLGVVFCHPFGEEERISYGATVRFARYLADRNIPSLRFSCQGFGDSEGDMVEASITSQISDVKVAISQLMREAQVPAVALIGVRFGATIARLVAESDDRVAALVLVSPVVQGQGFWNQILRSQQMSFMPRGLKTPKREDMLKDLAESGRIEFKGDLLSSQFVDEMSRIDLLATAGACKMPHLVAHPQGPEHEAPPLTQLIDLYRKETGPSFEFLHLQKEFWSTKALYEDEWPTDLFERTCTWLTGLRQ
jgi:uncharacterized protein